MVSQNKNKWMSRINIWKDLWIIYGNSWLKTSFSHKLPRIIYEFYSEFDSDTPSMQSILRFEPLLKSSKRENLISFIQSKRDIYIVLKYFFWKKLGETLDNALQMYYLCKRNQEHSAEEKSQRLPMKDTNVHTTQKHTLFN